jgi:hypothetical protein
MSYESVCAAAALARYFEQAALAIVASDPAAALRLALLASLARPGGGA